MFVKSIFPLHRFLLVTKGIPLVTYFGVSCVPSRTSRQFPNLDQHQLTGISKGSSSSMQMVSEPRFS